MKTKIKANIYMLICLFLLSFCLLTLAARMGCAQEAAVVFNKDVFYDIYYEASNYDGAWIEGARILGTAKIEGITFLVIRTSETTAQTGYILLNSIKAILPSGVRIRKFGQGR